MQRLAAWKALGAVAAIVLLLLTVAVPASADPIEGFIEAGPSVSVTGDISLTAVDPTVHIASVGSGLPEAPLVLQAARVEVTRVTHDISSLEVGQYPIDDIIVPGGGAETHPTETFENVSLEISAIRNGADILLTPVPETPLVAVAGPATRTLQLTSVGQDIVILDGFRKMNGEGQTGADRDFYFEHRVAGPLMSASNARELLLAGDADGYIWGANVLLRNTTEDLASYQTGYRRQESSAGTSSSEHYEYLLLHLTGLEATVRPGGLTAQTLLPAFDMGVGGRVDLSDVSGTLRGPDVLYRAPPSQTAFLEGNLTLAVAPRAASADARTLVQVRGDITATNLAPLELPGLLSTVDLVVVGASSVTLLGAAAWYLSSVKGAALLAPLARPDRRRPDASGDGNSSNHEEMVKLAEAPASPGDLLFDSDRFTLYQLVRGHAGLTADECARVSGIEGARAHLDLLADHGLIVPMTDSPRRYCLPGTVPERRVPRVALLRDEEVFRVARILALHGLTPETLLLQRAAKARPPVGEAATRRVVRRLLDHGLVIREPGEDGPVVDPTEEMYACLKLMGEHALAGTA